MPTIDPARAIKDGLASWWTAKPFTADALTLNVSDDAPPPWLLVADDGGPSLNPGAWLLRKTPKRITIRLTAAMTGRTAARALVEEAADQVIDNRPAAISRIDGLSTPLITRDRATGAWLASVTMPVIVRPV